LFEQPIHKRDEALHFCSFPPIAEPAGCRNEVWDATKSSLCWIIPAWKKKPHPRHGTMVPKKESIPWRVYYRAANLRQVDRGRPFVHDAGWLRTGVNEESKLPEWTGNFQNPVVRPRASSQADVSGLHLLRRRRGI